jgi:cell cycle arrest protein BUB3
MITFFPFPGYIFFVIYRHDFANNTDIIIGNHTNAVKSLLYNSSYHLCVSGSWDKTIKLWDIQGGTTVSSSSSSSSVSSSSSAAAMYSTKAIAKLDIPDKVYSMTKVDNHVFMVATANRQILTYDIRKLNPNSSNDCLVSSRESSLKHQTRSICASPTGTFLAVSSTEGRVGIDYIDSTEQNNSYAFKCHRKKENENEIAYPVHALSFHPIYGTFVTGAGDGNVYFWDAKARKRIAAIGPYNNSITALNFSPNGNYLAIAASYDFTGGDKDHVPDTIIIRNITDAEVKPKTIVANK